jgi:hypothetical protein
MSQRPLLEGDRVRVTSFGDVDAPCDHDDCVAQRKQFVGRTGTVALTGDVVVDEGGLLRVELDDTTGLGWFAFLPVLVSEVELILDEVNA